MLESSLFEVNALWVVFKLNDAPVSTRADGDFDVLCVMDARSRHILSTDFVPLRREPDPASHILKLVKAAQAEAGASPSKILMMESLKVKESSPVLTALGCEVEAVSEQDLSELIREAKESFRAHASAGRLQ